MAGKASDAVVTHDCRDTWAATLADLARADERIVAVVNDSVGSSKLGAFQKEFPARTVNVGIAEQDMVGVAAGLANGGRRPFVSAAGCFLTARAMEQVKADIAYSRYPVVLVGQSPGVAYGDLGPTHHSIEDFAWLRTLPGLVVLAPADPWETEQAVRWAAAYDGPVYLRVSRMAVPDIPELQGQEFSPGRAVVVREGDDVALLGTGVTLARAVAAAELLAAEGISARVLAMTSIAPLDADAVVAAAAETRGLVTVEEAMVTGLGGAVAEVLAERHPAPLRRIGFREFAITGSAEWLLDYVGASPAGIAAAARELL